MNNDFQIPNYIQNLLQSYESGLHSIVNTLSQLLNVPIIVTDTLYQILATSVSDNSNCDCQINFDYYFEPKQAPNFFDCVWTVENIQYSSFGYQIVTKNEPIGYIFLINNNEEINLELESLQPIISYAATLCSFKINTDLKLKEEQLQYKDAFLFDLIYGNLKSDGKIISNGKLWHWDFSKPHAIAVFSITNFDKFSVDTKLLKPLPNFIESILSSLGLDPILLQLHSEIVVIFPVKDDSPSEQKSVLSNYSSTIVNQIRDTEIGDRIAVGLGQVYNKPTELFRSYQEAKVASEIGILLNIEIPYFGNTGLERILYKHDLQDLREYYNHTIGLLIEHDKENDGELMDTLEAFALHQFDLTKASNALFLHRNTLRYRLNKVEEVLDIKLDDMINRLNILAAIKIKQLHKNLL